jgi:predicted transcriptional regulator of viral defense system
MQTSIPSRFGKDHVSSQSAHALALLEQAGMLRARDLRIAGIADETLARLVRLGAVRKLARGLYQHVDAEDSHQSLEQAALLIPEGILCLTTALVHHGLTLQIPRQLWMGLLRGSRIPRQGKSYRYVWFGEVAQTLGVERVMFGKTVGRMTGPIRTVLDCFRYRSDIGLDIALEGLRNLLKRADIRPADIARMARQLRIWTVVRPYLEALSADD